jgi:hypothetical protein
MKTFVLFGRNTVITSRYLSEKKLVEHKKRNHPVKVELLPWYINPNRFCLSEKDIDVSFVASMNTDRRRKTSEEVKAICEKNNWSCFAGVCYGEEYANILSRTKVFVAECGRKCLTQKYMEASLSGCTLVGDIPIYPSNNYFVYPMEPDLEGSIKKALSNPVVNEVKSDFLSQFKSIIKRATR